MALPSRLLSTLVLTSLAAAGCCSHAGKGDSSNGLEVDQGDGSGSAVDFGNVLIYQPSSPRQVTIANTGSAPLTVGTATLGGANPGDFKLTSAFPETIAPGAHASATAVFTPGAAGARSATLSVVTDGSSGNLSIPLSGYGVDIQICAAPASLSFGPVQVAGTPVSMSVTVTNCGQSEASFSTSTISGPQAADFSSGVISATALQANQTLTVQVSYSPAAVGPSTGNLGYQACDGSGDCASGSIPLSGTGVDGALSFSPDPIAFGDVPTGQSASQTITATNPGTEPITITALGTYSGNQAIFSIEGEPSLPASLAAGASLTFSVAYDPSGNPGGDADELVGVFTVADPAVLPREATDPLTGNGSASPCSLSVSPTSLDFGNVPPNVVTTYGVTLTNESSTSSCQITNVALASGSDASFSLPSSQQTSFSIVPSGTATISVTVDPASASPPLLKKGTLDFDTNGTPAAESVPLSAYVNAACGQAAAQLIYTVDEDGTFCSFDPTTLTFTVIGALSCPASSGSEPFSMAVDQNAVAWVLYDDGQIFEVNTSNAACQSTSFTPDQDGLLEFGMSFMSDPTTGADTLYVAGGQSDAFAETTTLATIAFPSLALSPVGSVTLGWPELTGTGDGQLWGFFPSDLSTTGSALLAQLDPTSGAELSSINLSQLNAESDDNFALKFYGGAFWLFLGNSVYEIQRSSGALTTPLPNSGHAVVGAGVSTCAPVQ